MEKYGNPLLLLCAKKLLSKVSFFQSILCKLILTILTDYCDRKMCKTTDCHTGRTRKIDNVFWDNKKITTFIIIEIRKKLMMNFGWNIILANEMENIAKVLIRQSEKT